MDELGIGGTFRDIAEMPRGLIRVTSDKSTTLAAMMDCAVPFAETGHLALPPCTQTSLTTPSSGLSTISRRTGSSRSEWTFAEPGRSGGGGSDRQATGVDTIRKR